MKKLLRKWMALVLAMTMVLSLAACGEEEEGTVLRVCLGGAQDSLDPVDTESDDNATILYHLYENLLRQKSEGVGAVTLDYAVCSAYTEMDNYDGTITYSFVISPTAKWSDGKAVTAEDFVYSWRRLLMTEGENRELLSMIQGYEEAIESGDAQKLAVSVTEDGMLQVTLSYHCPYFLTAVCAGAATMPVRQDVVERAGESFGTNAGSIVTNGAYVMANWEKRERLDLVRNPASESTRGADKLQFIFETSRETAYERFNAGEIDYIAYLPDEAVEKLKQNEEWVPTPAGMTEAILFNRSKAFDDFALRKAFTLATNVESIEMGLMPADQIATGLVPYGIRESDGEDFRTVGGELLHLHATAYEERCAEAKALLRQQETLPGEVELIYIADAVRESQVQILRTGWQDGLGIRVKLIPLTEEEMELRLAEDDYDMAWLTVRALCADGSVFLESGSSGLEEAIAEDDVEYSRLMSVLRGALDPLARDNYLHAAEKMTFEECSVLPLIFKGTTQTRRDGVRGVGYDGLGRYLFHEVSFAK